MKDRDVISAFVAYLQTNGHPNLKVERWPEDENRDSQEIDAIAGAFAIEHTSIDTLPWPSAAELIVVLRFGKTRFDSP
jgi:hypothetical protein